MKAYKCDICKEYCDDVFKVDGLSEPKTHIVGSMVDTNTKDKLN